MQADVVNAVAVWLEEILVGDLHLTLKRNIEDVHLRDALTEGLGTTKQRGLVLVRILRAHMGRPNAYSVFISLPITIIFRTPFATKEAEKMRC